MSDIKLSSDEVPEKFADWLLAMGCPPEKVPPVHKIRQMCRGTYYLVWRNLMEQVESKDIIKQKRLQVFADDVRRCKKKGLFTERDSNVLIPPELSLWREQTDMQRKVAEAEARVADAKRNLNEVMDKVSSRMSQRNLARQRVQDAQRRSWLLQLVAEDLRTKKQSLTETRAIAEDMCSVHERTDVQPPLEKCLSSMRRQTQGPAAASSTIVRNSSASKVYNGDVDEESMTRLAQCRGDALWSELYARRAALVASLSSKADRAPDDNRPGFQSVLSQTAALQCSLALEALKCREMARRAQLKLADVITDLNSQLSSGSCELLVVRCERARSQARAEALRALLADVSSRAGVFHAPLPDEREGSRALIDRRDRDIEIKKDEIKSVVSAIALTERKIANVRECLANIFSGFNKDMPVANISSGRGIQLELGGESLSGLRQYYEQRREKRRNKMELSMEFDISECSFNEIADLNKARFIDELKIYLKKFNLDKNRKLVLESGEKIWIFETLQSSVARLHSKWQTEDVTCSLLCPSTTLQRNVLRLLQAVELKDRLSAFGKGGRSIDVDMDINKYTDEEDRIIDKVKKRLGENLRSLQKTAKTLNQGQQHLDLWSDNQIKNHISHARTVAGKPYKAYETYYLEYLEWRMS